MMGAAANLERMAPRLTFGLRREMARNFGGVEKHSSGRWCIRMKIEGQTYRSFSAPMGKRSIPYRTRENALDVLEEIRAEIRRGTPPVAAVSPYLQRAELHSVERWWSEWTAFQDARADAGQISPVRARKLREHLSSGHLEPIRKCLIHSVGTAELEQLQVYAFEQGLKPKSVHHVLADVRSFFAWLEERSLVVKVPRIPRTAVPRYVPDIPTPAQQEAFLGAIPWELRGIFLARGYNGLRPAEAKRALLSDYRRGESDDGSQDTLRVRAKGGRDRLVPVDRELARWVREHRPALGEAGELLFPGPSGGAWADQTARRHLLEAMKTSCKRVWKPNEALRHCFGTRAAANLLGRGEGQQDVVRRIMMAMGHTSHTTSARYVQLAAESLRGILPHG